MVPESIRGQDAAMASLARVPFRRSPDRLVGGVCAGAAERLGVDPLVIRLAMLLFAFTPVVGILGYVGAWWLLPLDRRPPTTPTVERAEWLQALQRDDPRTLIGAACLGLGGTYLIRTIDVVGGDVGLLAATLIALGIGVAWVRTDPAERDRLRSVVGRASGSPGTMLRGGPGSISRLAFGLVLVVAGGIALVAGIGGVSGAGAVFLAAVVSAGGLGLLIGPWAVGILRVAGEERRQRIRSEERAELAAQLHDSVLQTLVLIQRSAGSGRPTEAVALARRQERELRSWLYGDGGRIGGAATTLAAALEAVASEVEGDHGIDVELVTVGDRPLDEAGWALVAAAREAMVNAAKHAGVTSVDCYAEADAGGGGVRVYVRDRGAGFDPAAVADDRRGIAESITARLARAGGKATVSSEVGVGTEVALEVPG